ncbi:unnamed protein product [Pieris macdunnoughi]|uniref:Uncharacterized protein n=1 Tax=Pieris macdunnoughi TaxID=345717 RepID=A0A821MLE6_9NEOP|nr:unnamed protein product [Pieris macdunnoughi]
MVISYFNKNISETVEALILTVTTIWLLPKYASRLRSRNQPPLLVGLEEDMTSLSLQLEDTSPPPRPLDINDESPTRDEVARAVMALRTIKKKSLILT